MNRRGGRRRRGEYGEEGWAESVARCAHDIRRANEPLINSRINAILE